MLEFSNIILLWLNANIFNEQFPFVLSRTPIEQSLADTNSFKSSGATKRGQVALHSLPDENGQVLVIILTPLKLMITARR